MHSSISSTLGSEIFTPAGSSKLQPQSDSFSLAPTHSDPWSQLLGLLVVDTDRSLKKVLKSSWYSHCSWERGFYRVFGNSCPTPSKWLGKWNNPIKAPYIALAFVLVLQGLYRVLILSLIPYVSKDIPMNTLRLSTMRDILSLASGTGLLDYDGDERSGAVKGGNGLYIYESEEEKLAMRGY
jgi:hypothetical protein